MLPHLKELLKIPTPFYYYDMDLFERTALEALKQAKKYGFDIHYALKANFNEPLLKKLSGLGFNADCVSGNEVELAVKCGFKPEGIVYAGVGKSDEEIKTALRHRIFCFNCESEQELEVINAIAAEENQIAQIALRINPNVDAHTHHYITTGLDENKFGINLWQIDVVLDKLKNLRNLKLIALHVHIGSQITNTDVFKTLCLKVNELQLQFESKGFALEHLNMGGGLGINYQNPDKEPIPDFKSYFEIFHQHLTIRPGQKVHFELGRSIVGQCGSLISKVLYTKELKYKTFIILDAGINDLIRPALYDAYHHIQNLTAVEGCQTYDVVGPICESSDCFATEVELPQTKRGDVLALRSAGAYGEAMASRYNYRDLPGAVYSDGIMDV